MIDLTDIKTIATGIAGNGLLFLSNIGDFQTYVQIFWHSAVSMATIYYLYRNHKKKK